jgi:hypothetical protein
MPRNERIAKALAVALEVTGSPAMSVAAGTAFTRDLEAYPEPLVLAALRRCMREVKGKLTLADVIQRIDDGRPTPEVAWSMVPKDEGASVCWTTEMRDAYALAHSLVKQGELVQARMAFIEGYRIRVQSARDARLPVEWQVSLGLDKSGRELVLLDAVQKGWISVNHARSLLPYHRDDEELNARLLAIEGIDSKALPAPAPMPHALQERIAALREKWKGISRE